LRIKFEEKSVKNYEMIGESEAINHIKVMIEKVAQTEARVLITGPNGRKIGCPSITRKGTR
jgi:DNA-binding NtrC family response regulator